MHARAADRYQSIMDGRDRMEESRARGLSAMDWKGRTDKTDSPNPSSRFDATGFRRHEIPVFHIQFGITAMRETRICREP
jgi:hypothetical protein